MEKHLRDDLEKWKAPELKVHITKGLNTYVKVIFQFFPFHFLRGKLYYLIIFLRINMSYCSL